MIIRIKHEISGRIRFATNLGKLTDEKADSFQYYLQSIPQVINAKVYAQSGNAAVTYQGDKKALIEQILKFSFDCDIVRNAHLQPTARKLNREYSDRLVFKFINRALFKIFVPAPIRTAYVCVYAVKYIAEGIKCLLRRKIEVPVLDATAITVSLLRRDFKTASSVMFLLGIGEIMEEWTHKKSVADLAGSMSLNADKVWLHKDEGDVLVPVENVLEGDMITVTMGSMIPLDGVVASGEAIVNQSSLTGESAGVRKSDGSSVFAGTVLEEGELVIEVKKVSGATRYEKITRMIEESEKMKSSVESRAEHLADKLVPYSFLGSGLAYLLTRNVQKAVSVLMVDFSCALKLSMPVTVLSAMREANEHSILVKGGKFMEAVAEADTIVFDKTGTLTKAQPKVREVIPFNGNDRDEMLRTAACLEEHFPHSIANAVVEKAAEEGLAHEEMHAKVSYIIAHGIASEIGNEEVRIGSYHFIFEDEGCVVPEGERDKFDNLPEDCSLLYLAIGKKLSAVICIEDPLREEAAEVISSLKKLGIKNVVMMTGDSERTARVIAEQVGVDAYYSEVLPEDKARFVEKEKAEGHKVIMIGDGINDSPALSAADVGIAISEGAQLAREIADITISQDNLYGLVILKALSNELIKRINSNYRFVIGFNSGLLIAGLIGIIAPGTSAFLHNMSTLGIGLHSMTNLLESVNIK